MMTTGGWDGQDHHMSATTEDEFNQFLDMTSMGHMGDDMQFDFNGFQAPTTQAMMNRPREAPDTVMGDGNSSSAPMMPQAGAIMRHQAPHMPSQGHAHQGPPVSSQMIPTSAPTSDSISSIDAQIQYLQQQKFQQQQRQLQERAVFFQNQSRNVPPTPQSLEMPPNSGHFYQHDQMPQEVYDRNYQQRMKEQQDMSFTPLVSPAVTPLEPHFHMDSAFTVPGAYFSPLTSPALHAQNDAASVYDPSTHSNNSPVEIELDTTTGPAAPTVDLSKKARKNNAAKTRKQGVKSSPISKPQRRKPGPSPAILSQVLSEVEERANGAPDMSTLPMAAASTDASDEYASVSPENLNDMPPPPVPARRSTSKSPYIAAQTSAPMSTTPTPPAGPGAGATPNLGPQSTDEPAQPHPATPASLMKLPASKSKRPIPSSQETATENIESLVLPESVSKQSFTPIDTAAASREAVPAGPQSAKATSFQPLASPLGPKRPGTASAGQSPQILPGSTGPTPRKTPQLASRASRKRSTGSVHVSPALLPRISPNIKPLLPGTPGMSSDDATSRLLTSKSNYQNILEGNTVPGLHYNTDLSANLTSKRTSHKIAEQGRRNRINSALQEMAGLLPDKHKLGSGDDSDKKDSKQANAANSKASVVEKAIVHLKHLELENVGLKKELEELKAKMEKVKEPS